MTPEGELKKSILKSVKYADDILLFVVRNGVADYGDGRFVKLGMINGMSDLVFGQSFIIRPEHVGRLILHFGVAELKIPGHRTDKERLRSQSVVIDNVVRMGGVGGFATSVEEFQAIRNMWNLAG